MYSLPNPSESERPFSPLEEPVSRALGRRGGGARNGFLCFAPGTPLHWLRRSQDPKARYHWLWAVGAGVAGTLGGRDGDWEWKGGGWRIFYRRPELTSSTLAFFKSMCSAHSPCGIKKANNFKVLKFQIKKKTYKGWFLSIMVNKFRIFIKNLRNTYGLHFTKS